MSPYFYTFVLFCTNTHIRENIGYSFWRLVSYLGIMISKGSIFLKRTVLYSFLAANTKGVLAIISYANLPK